MHKLARIAAAAAVSAAALTATAGPASADVWPCDGHWCAKVVNTTGVYELYVGSPTIYYYAQKGETVMIVCHAWNGTYHGGKPGWRSGWMRGFDLNTGHDPNPNVPPCN